MLRLAQVRALRAPRTANATRGAGARAPGAGCGPTRLSGRHVHRGDSDEALPVGLPGHSLPVLTGVRGTNPAPLKESLQDRWVVQNPSKRDINAKTPRCGVFEVLRACPRKGRRGVFQQAGIPTSPFTISNVALAFIAPHTTYLR